MWGAFYLPRTPNARGVCEAWAAASDEEEPEAPDPIRLLVISGDEALANDDVRALAETVQHVLVIAMFERPARGFADVLLPGTSYLERDGTYVNLEGRLQRLRRASIPPAPDELGWLSKLGERFGVDDLALSRRSSSTSSRRSSTTGSPSATSASRRRCAPRRPSDEPIAAPNGKPAAPAAAGLRLVTYRPLFSGPAVERVPELQFQRPEPVLELSAADARARGIEPGDEVDDPRERDVGSPARPPVAEARRRDGARRRGARARARPRRRAGEALMHEPWWISLIKAFLVINLLLLAFAYTTWFERKLLGRMQNRYGPNRAGPFGLLQPIADLVKLIRKESFFPAAASDLPYIIAPVVSAFTALAAFSVIPFGPGWEVNGWHIDGVVVDVPIALIFVFALGSIGVYGFIVGGWASESKYSLLGSMRTCAQLVSYEVSLALSVLGVVLMGQSLAAHRRSSRSRRRRSGSCCRSSSAS